jgi:predicted nucleotidyltransferase
LNLSEELFQLTAQLDLQGVDYAVCGGMAVGAYGYPRLTIDLDLLIQESDLPKAKLAALAVGFDLETGWLPLSQKTDSRIFRLIKVEGKSFLPLDLMIVESMHGDYWSDRKEVNVEGRRLKMVSLNSLIQMKRDSTRGKDRIDLEFLEEIAGNKS